jgi:hypothetical protein
MFPVLKFDLGFSDKQLGLVGAYFLWVYGLGSFLTGHVTTRVWTTGLFDRNSFSLRNTARCGVASDWADCSIITSVRQHERSDHQGSGVRFGCASDPA